MPTRKWVYQLAAAWLLFVAPIGSAAAAPIHAVFLIHEIEYETSTTVPEFAKAELEEKLGWKCTFLIGNDPHDLPGTEILADADLMFVSVRRQALPESQMKYVRAYCESGKPVVGIRTASHAFSVRKNRPPNGVEWPEFDHDILGGNYHGHYDKNPEGSDTSIWSDSDNDHPILQGVSPEKRITASWLYQVQPLAASATPLVRGQVEENPVEPVAWTHTGIYGNRVFYTSLGHPEDFKSENFRRLLTNGIRWAVNDLTIARK